MNTWKVLCEREKRWPSLTPLYVWLGGQREREGTHTQKPGSGNGKCQSDRGQVIGGKLLIGQLAPWVTWDI